MPKIQFYPVSLTYKIVKEKPVVLIFGRLANGEQICVMDENVEPYFYVMLRRGEDFDAFTQKALALKLERRGGIAKILRTELIEKKFLGKPTQFVKVFADVPPSVPTLREELRRWAEVKDVHEADIQFTRRYLIDKQITPMTLCEAEGEFVTARCRVPVLKADQVKQFSDETLTEPKILAFDIETYNPAGKVIAPDRFPVVMLAFYGKDFKKVITWKRFTSNLDELEVVTGEAELLERFKEVVNEYKPDILCGYFSDGFDLPYLKARADKHRIKLDIGLDYSEFDASGGREGSVEIAGICHLDVFKFVIKVLSKKLETDTFGLDEVAEEILGEKKIPVNMDALADAWDNASEKLDEFAKYNLQDAYLTYNLCERSLPNVIEFVKIISLPPFDATRMAFSQFVEWYLLKQAFQFGEVAPNKPHHDELNKRKASTYQGGFVFEPKPGLFNDIVVFDFRSLYPTIISAHNISPGTLNCACCEGKADPVPTEDKQKVWFCTKKKGFIPTIIEDLISRRARIKQILKETKDQKTRMLLDARQDSLKLMANSFYGYLGFAMARWYSWESANAVTAYGRHYIKKVISEAEKRGFTVLYSDTDSVFMRSDGLKKDDALKFAEFINMQLPGLMELDYEGFYPSGIFVSAKAGAYGAKKKYALLREDGYIKLRGFEAVRRNWSQIAKEVQEAVIDIVLKEHNVDKAKNYVKKMVNELRQKRIPNSKVIIYTQLQKSIAEYDSKGPHVVVAEKMRNAGVPVGPGSMIKYIVAVGKGSVGDRAEVPDKVADGEYDADYYVNNQVVPAVGRIFDVLGVKEEELLEEKEQSKLKAYFG